MNMIVDLHTHTTCSDGVLSPLELLKLAASKGISHISITDHDTIAAYDTIEQSTESAENLPTLLSGIEVSSMYKETEIHVLGYGFDLQNEGMRDWCLRCQEHRHLRYHGMVEKLQKLGVDIQVDTVPDNPGRLHLAHLLVEQGATNSLKKAFKKYLANGKPAWVPKLQLETHDAVELIVRAGGIAVLAHPGHGFSARWVESFMEAGLQGIECVHPMHRDRTTSTLFTYAAMKNLIATGGSDFHGSRQQDRENIGTFVLTGDRARSTFQALSR